MTKRRGVSLVGGCETSKIDCGNGCTTLTILCIIPLKKKKDFFIFGCAGPVLLCAGFL